jgi:predicted metal-dependent HD superfamily phosphohydrolase
MTQPETEIRTAWRRIAGHHHDGYIDDVLIRYAEPHRHYHTATHVMFVMRHLRDIAEAMAVTVTAGSVSRALVAAALYHDAIYQPGAADNETASAALAAHDLADVGWPADDCRAVADLIMATAGHLADNTEGSGGTGGRGGITDTAILLDADLAILGAEPAVYAAYVNGVRAEYGHIDDGQWRAGRGAVLVRFLDRNRLYSTDYMHASLDRRARANMEAELATMRAG